MKYEKLWKFSKEDLEHINALISELSDNAPDLNGLLLNDILVSGGTKIFVARDHGDIVGLACLVIIDIPTGRRCRFEDLVVSKHYRNKGVGSKLTELVIKEAELLGARNLDCTSKSSRGTENFFTDAGFERYDTNVYRIEF